MIESILPIIGNVISKIFPDPEKANEAKIKLLELQQQGELAKLDADLKIAIGQIEINKIDAANPRLFNSGWRPAIGWMCVFGLFYSLFLFPFLVWGSSIFKIPAPPELHLEVLVTLLGGLLGLGGMRTFEKVKGVASK